MKNLHQSLIDYDIALLEAIAANRGISLASSGKGDIVDALTETLLSPTETAIMLDSLSAAESNALYFLLEKGGRSEEPRFTRQYGVIRSMGAARLEREKPWQHPANPAEGLWYKGFIFKAFQLTPQGNIEIIYIPTDLLALLKPFLLDEADEPDELLEAAKTKTQTATRLQPVLLSQPADVITGEGRLRESMFSLLAYLQTHPLRLQSNQQISDETKTTLADSLPPSLWSGFDGLAEVEFLLHLGLRTKLLAQKYGRLRPDREATRAWLQASAVEQVTLLRNSWRSDPTWNDLWHVPGVKPQPTGWENSPLLARSKILDYLAEISQNVSPGDWVSLADFINDIKQLDPDFQRPDGDYQSWYIYDRQGQPLMGFEHWDAVEGGLIRYLVSHILLLLGLIDIGLTGQPARPTSFQITPDGQLFLTNQKVPQQPKRPLFLRVKPNFRVEVPLRAALYDRFQLTRFAYLEHREENRTIYHITQASVGRALRNGVTADQIVAFLARASNNRTPLKVVETVRTWGHRRGAARLERATILHLDNESLLDEIRHTPTLRPLLGETIGPTAILIPADNVREVRRLLLELGYLSEGKSDDQ